MTATNDSMPTPEREGFDLKELPDEVTNRAHEIWLAGLGALSRLEQEGDNVFQSLVERGKSYEHKRREQIEDATENLRERQKSFAKDVTQRLDEATKSVEEVVSDTLSETLGSIGVPTRNEVQGLSRRVGELSQKLDALSKMLDAQQTAVEDRILHVVPDENDWAVIIEGENDEVSTYATKKEAVSTARDVAKEHAPSRLIVHKQDRSVQESFSYDSSDAT